MHLIHRVLEHRARAVVALLALALAALGLAACGSGGSDGGSGGGSTADAQTLLAQTFTGTHAIKSGKASLDLKVNVQGGSSSLNGPIELKLVGPFQSAGSDAMPKFDLALDVHVQGQGFKAGLTSTSDQLFVKFGGTAYEIPASVIAKLKQSFASKPSKSGLSIGDLGIEPMKWLKDPTVTGTETIGGVETEHVSASLDVDALLDDVDTLLGKVKSKLPAGAAGAAAAQIPDKLPADTRAKIKDAVKQSKVDIWTGKDDHTLRKLTLTLAVEPPASANAPKSVDVSLSLELQDLNQPQTIETPTATRPISELLSNLQGLLGGALGAGALGGSGSGSNAPPNIDEYTQCLQDAKGNVTKAQACAAVLTQ